NTLEATQTQIGTRVVTDFPLCDQEILLRHLHMTAHQYVDRYEESKANGNGSSNGKHAAKKDEAHV
ncbi:MAG: aromatic ring-hydroxylating dioxygenase subunit alpha, partial [Mycobacterium sp.]